MKDKLISIVVPCHNENGNISIIYDRLKEVLSETRYNIIFVNDGSTDNTLDEIKKLSDINNNVSYISFSRNFGHQAAIKAGIDKATGDAIITMDADLQHPPEFIPKLIDQWNKGYMVVNAIRSDINSLSRFKKSTSMLFYKLLSYLGNIPVVQGAADFRLIDKKVAKTLKQLPEKHLFIRGIISWLGFSQISINYMENKRLSGDTKYTFKKMVSFGLCGLTSFSVRPLRISLFMGIVMAIIAFLYGIYAIFMVAFTSQTVNGWASVIASVLFLSGLQLIILGIIGEYIGKMFIEGKQRPNYVIEESCL